MFRRVLNPKWKWPVAAVSAAAMVGLSGCPSEATAAKQPPPTAMAPALPPTQAQVATQKEAAAKKQQSSKEQQLIDRVDRSYQSGVANYRGGRLDAARQDFDFAVDMMLTSGMDLKTEGPMSDEFERVVSAVNALELDSLQKGNGFSVPVEESPVEAAGELTFGHDEGLTAQVNSELKTTKSDLPLVVNDYVTGYINYFSNNQNGRAHLVRSLERAGKYEVMIKRILREEGVPEDLIYQAVAESGFQPQALNAKSGAGGMWQFMPFRGAYGLERNGWFDERFDPEKSTRAYARYMKSLYDQLGDWYLVMAAYDWGPGNIQRAVMRTGYADFWTLYKLNALPKETKNYVPAMLAAVIMSKNPAQYGLTNMKPEPPLLSDTVQVNYATDLRLVADVTGVSLPTIVGMNPSLLRMQTPRDMNFDLHIPVGTKDAFLKRMNEIPEDKRTTWRFHEVTAGESMDQIASSYHVRATDLAATNGIKDDEEVDVGDELVIPVVSISASASSATSARPTQYRVKAGDTLVTIADRFGVSSDQLRRWNHMRTSAVAVGRTIVVDEPVHLAPSGRGTRVRGKKGAHTSAGGSRSGAKATRTSGKRGVASTKSAAPSTKSSHASAKAAPKKKKR